MRRAILLAMLIAGCGEQGAQNGPVANVDVPSQAGGWDLARGGDGATLTLAGSAGAAGIRLICPAGEDRLIVNVPSFDPVGSEERLSFGQGGEVVALVADPSGDALRGGVTAEGPVPANLVDLLSGEVAASYGAQQSGPHPTPPAALVNGFAAACSGAASNGSQQGNESEEAPQGQENVSACLIQDGERLRNPPLRAIGTEPFWGATTNGRCVTYSHPEDIDGTRVWTKYEPGPDGSGTWSGALGGREFRLTIRSKPGCSDGMSDKRYAWEAQLRVHGESRTGCAEPR